MALPNELKDKRLRLTWVRRDKNTWNYSAIIGWHRLVICGSLDKTARKAGEIFPTEWTWKCISGGANLLTTVPSASTADDAALAAEAWLRQCLTECESFRSGEQS